MRFGFLFFRYLARRDVAPGPDDLQWFAIWTGDQTLLVIHPAIRIIFAAKAILYRVGPILEEFGDSILYAGQIVGVNPVAPEGRLLQVLVWCKAEYVENVVAYKGGSIITGSLEAVNYCG